MKKNLLFALLVSLFLVSCTKYWVDNGKLRDTIFSVEKTRNGNVRVFFTHDDVAGYCTSDQELGDKAESLMLEHSGEVIAEFTDMRGTEEWNFWSSSDCGSVSSGESSMVMFRLDDIYAVPSRD